LPVAANLRIKHPVPDPGERPVRLACVNGFERGAFEPERRARRTISRQAGISKAGEERTPDSIATLVAIPRLVEDVGESAEVQALGYQGLNLEPGRVRLRRFDADRHGSGLHARQDAIPQAGRPQLSVDRPDRGRPPRLGRHLPLRACRFREIKVGELRGGQSRVDLRDGAHHPVRIESNPGHAGRRDVIYRGKRHRIVDPIGGKGASGELDP
jgi:hypothetical protein